MRRLAAAVLIIATLSARAATAEVTAAEFYVAVTGSDDNPGSERLPFASLERARNAVRELLRSSGDLPAGEIVVWLRGGRHFRSEPFELDSRDSGKDGNRVAFRAYPGERPRLIGGVPIDAAWFEKTTRQSPVWDRLEPRARGKLFHCRLPENGIEQFGDLTSVHADPIHSELSFNGRIMQLGRWPNADFALVRQALSDTSYTYYGHQRPARWLSASSPWVNGYWRYMWANKYLPVTGIDTETKVITIADPPSYPISTGRFWYGLNLLEEIDVPGEWYLERHPAADDYGTVYLWPPGDIATAEILLSLHGGGGQPLVKMDGVEHVILAGITFEMTRADGMLINNSSDVLIEGCLLSNIGRNGITTENCTRVGIESSELSGIGSEAIRLSGGDRKSLTPGGNFVRNCHIHDFSRWKRTYSQAVRFHEGVGNEATHNLIHGTPHIAIGYSGNNHLIQFNEIYDACWETGDAGVIMGDWGWDSRGNRIVNNYLHDSVGAVESRFGFSAIYLDGSCAGDTIAGNIVHRSGSVGVMQNSGREVVISNNIFSDLEEAIHPTTNAYYEEKPGHAMNFLERIQKFDYRKPPWSVAYPELAKTPDDITDTDFERYKYPVGSKVVRNISIGTDYWVIPRQRGALDYFAIVEDNLFIDKEDTERATNLFLDRAEADFVLDGKSGAYDLPGFERLPREMMGRLQPLVASRPHPPDGQDGVRPFSARSKALHWAPAALATDRSVYFSAEHEAVAAGSERALLCDTSRPTCQPGELLPGTTYYWRVDERDARGNVLEEGEIWSFVTREAWASRPQPPDGATGVGSSVSLSWTAGAGAQTHDFYFGRRPTRTPADFAGRQRSTSYKMPNLANGETHYWRVDETDARGTTTKGVVWSFTTGVDGALTVNAGDRVDFNTADASCRINGALVSRGEVGDGIAAFQFGNLEIAQGAVIEVRGERPLEIRSSGSIQFDGTIDLSGRNGGDGFDGLHRGGAGRLGGAGGGGAGDTNLPGLAGTGPGAGRSSTNIYYGGGGAGFGGRGGAGTIELEQTAKAGHVPEEHERAVGGRPYGEGSSLLQGGSGGAGGGGGATFGASGPGGAGGGGGGAIRLIAARDISINGTIAADGGDGTGFRRTGGGGSGGMVALQAAGTVTLGDNAQLSAWGGHGGDCAWMGACGGGGGGGHIRISAKRLQIGDALQTPGVLPATRQTPASGGAGGYYAVHAENNGERGADGIVRFQLHTR